jgi:putative transposase
VEESVRAIREVATSNGQTYFVSFQSAKRVPLFRNERWAQFLFNAIFHYRTEYGLHDFAIMPDHVHLLITPHGALERSVQVIKGGFSFRARREFSWHGEIWQKGFSDHRLRDVEDVGTHLRYIAKNIGSLSEGSGGRRCCGTHSGLAMDAFPQWLKPQSIRGCDGGAEAPPLQSESALEPSLQGGDALEESLQSESALEPSLQGGEALEESLQSESALEPSLQGGEALEKPLQGGEAFEASIQRGEAFEAARKLRVHR